MDKDTFYFNTFIAENKDFVKNLRKSLLDNQSTTLQALAGGGKTHLTLKILIPFLADHGYRVLFVVPNTVQVSQLKRDGLFTSKDSDLNDTIVVYDSATKLAKNFKDKTPALICTYDKAFLAYKALYSIENSDEKIIFVIDEFHNLAKSIGYRSHAIMNIETLIEKTNCKTLFISATPVFSIINKFKSAIFRAVKRTSSIHNVKVLPVELNSFEENLISEIKRNLLDGKKSLVFINNKSKAKTIKKAIVKASLLTDLEIQIIQSEQTKTQSKEYLYLAENSQFSETTKVVLCTEILAQGLNILNTDFRNIYCALSIKDIDARIFTQFINRFRALLNGCQQVDTVILVNNDILTNKAQKKGLKDGINSENWFARKKYSEAYTQLSTVTPKATAKSKATRANLAIGQNSISSKYAYLYIDSEKGVQKMPSFFYCAYLAENDKIANQIFGGFLDEVKQYNPKDSIQVSYLTESLDNEYSEYLAEAKAETDTEKIDTIKALLSDFDEDFDLVLSFFKSQSRDFNTVSKLDAAETEIVPRGYELTDKNVYFKKLTEFVTLYNLTTKDIALYFLNIETFDSDGKDLFEIKTMRMAYIAFAISYDSYLLNLNSGEATKKAFNLIIDKRPKMRFALNMLSAILQAMNSTLIDSKQSTQKNITAEIKAIKEKIKTDKKNKSRYLKQIAKLESERNHTCGGVFLQYKEAFELVKDSDLYKYASIDIAKFRALVKFCTSVKIGKKGFEAKGIVDISFKNLAAACSLKESNIVKLFSEKLAFQVKRYNDTAYSELTADEKQMIAYGCESQTLTETINTLEALIALKDNAIDSLEDITIFEDIDILELETV